MPKHSPQHPWNQRAAAGAERARTRQHQTIRIREFHTPETLSSELPKVIRYVRESVMPHYVGIGRAGALAVAAMQRDIQDAENALATSDVAGMLRYYERLKEYRP